MVSKCVLKSSRCFWEKDGRNTFSIMKALSWFMFWRKLWPARTPDEEQNCGNLIIPSTCVVPRAGVNYINVQHPVPLLFTGFGCSRDPAGRKRIAKGKTKNKNWLSIMAGWVLILRRMAGSSMKHLFPTHLVRVWSGRHKGTQASVLGVNIL